MLDFLHSVTDCGGVSRRAFLRVGTASLFGASLPLALAAKAARGESGSSARDVNCILLFTDGGMSNLDTLDMKPDAPVEFRGEFSPVASNVPGMDVCEHMPWMARQMDKVCLVKSIAHTESGDHVAARHYMLTGYPQRPDTTGQPVGSTIYPSFGSLVSKQQGWRNGLPPYVLFGSLDYSGAGFLGSAFNPLKITADPSAAGIKVDNVSIPDAIGADRTMRRRRMLEQVDAWQRRSDAVAGQVRERQQFYQQAYDLITAPAAKRAFQIDEEPAALRDRYGRHAEGQGCLLARRLIEAGVRFVTVNSGGWDTHDKNFSRLKDSLLPKLDQAWSALLEDLSNRGLLDSTVVICCGEFGRTPRVNGAAGRDHYAPCNVVGISGAGVRMGTVVGQTNPRCENVVGTTHSTLDYAATVFRLLGIDGQREYRATDGRPILVNNGGRPISDVMA